MVLTPSAVADLRDAHAGYGRIEASLAEAFALAIDQVIERLELFPRSGTPVEGFDDLRRVRVRRFPCGVFYRFSDPDEVRVLRVLHDRRDRSAELSPTEP